MESTNSAAGTSIRTGELGLGITNAMVSDKMTVIDCRLVNHDYTRPTCGKEGVYRDSVARELTDLPVMGEPPGYESPSHARPAAIHTVSHEFFVSPPVMAAPKAKNTHRCARWMMQRLVQDRISTAQSATTLGLGWDVVNALALRTARQMVYSDPKDTAGVRVLGVDEHKWKHVPGAGERSFLTVLVDVTPVRDNTGPTPLIDIIPSRSAGVLES